MLKKITLSNYCFIKPRDVNYQYKMSVQCQAAEVQICSYCTKNLRKRLLTDERKEAQIRSWSTTHQSQFKIKTTTSRVLKGLNPK